jgi:AraC-like DNA-binding protein
MIPTGLRLPVDPGVQVEEAGVFVCPGTGRHPDRIMESWELIIVERGSLGLAVGDRAHDLAPGSWILMPPHTRHRGTRAYPSELRFLWLHFHVSRRRAAGTLLTLPMTGSSPDPVGASVLMRRLIDHRSGSDPDPLIANLLLALILAELAASPKAINAAEDLAARADRLIGARFREQVSSRDIASSLGVSVDHLGRCFQRSYGLSMIEALNRQRLREACRLLLLGGGRITDIARASGFPDGQWFRRLFHRQEGIGPRAWRRRHARIHTNTS